MLFFILIFLFIIGLTVGSFLNVLIYRLESSFLVIPAEAGIQKPDKESTTKLVVRKNLFGRSFCPHCGNQIVWHDNIPVISWLFLQGKCRNCKKGISVQYPLVELATGAIFSLIGYSFLVEGFMDSGQARMTDGISALFTIPSSFVIPALSSVIPAEAGIQSLSEKGSLDFVITSLGMTTLVGLFFWLFFAACFIVIFVYDLKHQIIPDEVIYPALVAGLLYVLAGTLLHRVTPSQGSLPYVYDHLLSGFLAGGFFYLLAAVSKGKWMGGGDIKLVAFMGLVLGLTGILVALYIAFVLGALVGTITLLTKHKKLGSKIAFGPFLVIGTFASLFFRLFVN